MNVSLMTQKIALRLESSKGDHIESWFRSMQELSDNPFGVAIFQKGNVRAFLARHLQGIGLFNQVIGFGPDDKELLPEIRQFYQDHDVEHYRIEVNPYLTSSDFLAYLANHKFYQSSFETYLYRTLSENLVLPPTEVTIRDVTSSEIDLFADIHVKGFQEALEHVPEKTRSLYRECTKVLYKRSEWHLFLAWFHDIPIGMGMLYTHNGIALLAGGATLPQMRGHGCQTALLHHRVVRALQNHCPLLVGQTSIDSTSQHNMERLGMRTAYTAATWTRSFT